MRTLATIGLMLFTVTAARAQGPLPSVTLPPELARVLRDYERAWQAGGGTDLAALFTSDGFRLSPGSEPLRGSGAIEEKYRAASGSPLVLRALAFATADTVGYIIGVFGRRAGEPDVGKFVLALRRDETGRWLIAADMDNGNASNE